MKARTGQSRITALDNFHAALRVAKQTLDDPKGDDLSAMAGALIATIDYLDAFQETKKEGLKTPIELLLNDIVNIRPGKQPRFLKSDNSKREIGLLSNARIGYAVAAVDRLKTAGFNVGDAAKLVARTCEAGGMKNYGNPRAGISKRTVENWRKKVSQDVAGTTPAAIVRKYEAETMLFEPDTPKDSARKITLRRLKEALSITEES